MSVPSSTPATTTTTLPRKSSATSTPSSTPPPTAAATPSSCASTFPASPFAKAKPAFDRLSELGWALVQAHLLKAVPKPMSRLGRYHGRGDHAVEQPRWSPAEDAVWINQNQRFAPVPEAVWQFHIGGYQVLEKYLKSRKGRTLSLDEIEHIGKVAEVLAFTIAQMAEIDEAYCAAFSGDNAEAPLATSA